MTVYFRPRGDITKAPIPRSERDVELHRFISEKTGLEVITCETVDFEDWTEPATMLAAALRAGLEVSILPRVELRRAVMNPVVTVPGRPCRDMLIGFLTEQDRLSDRYFDLGWPLAKAEQANHYAELETFWRHAGRKIALADMPGDREAAGDRKTVFARGVTSDELGAVMQTFPVGGVIVKQVYPAKAFPLVSLRREKDFVPADGPRAFFGKVGFHFARFEGDPAALLVQERITMTHETRVFVIGHKIVTAGACIESHTPTTHAKTHARTHARTHPLLEPVFEKTRNSGQMDESPLPMRKLISASLLRFAEQVCKEIAAEAPDLDAYVLDVALDGARRPIIVELNPAVQAGLYGIDADKLFDAIHAYAEAAPHRTPKSWTPEAFTDGVGTQITPPETRIMQAFSEEDEEYSDEAAFLDFIAEDLEKHPENAKPMSQEMFDTMARLTEGMKVDLDAPIVFDDED